MEGFEYLFGQEGTAVAFFGGNWWMLGVFIILLIATVMYQHGSGSTSIALFVLFSSVVMIAYPIFTYLETVGYIQIIVFFVLIFSGWFFYKWVNR